MGIGGDVYEKPKVEREREDMNLKGRNGRVIAVAASFVGAALLCFLLYTSADPLSYYYYNYRSSPNSFLGNDREDLESVLRNASTKAKTVIITTLNDVWAEPKSKSMLDLFLKSFRIGNKTTQLLDHLLIVGLDQKAYERCLEIHPHCYLLKTRGSNFSGEVYFMMSDYLHMMWRRIEFLGFVLELGYDFVFTDVDIMWLQDPFQHFYEDGDFQIACDFFWGKPDDLENKPNGGFNYVKSNEKTIQFYKYWYDARLKYPGLHDQDVLNKIKFDPFLSKIGIKIRSWTPLTMEDFASLVVISTSFAPCMQIVALGKTIRFMISTYCFKTGKSSSLSLPIKRPPCHFGGAFRRVAKHPSTIATCLVEKRARIERDCMGR